MSGVMTMAEHGTNARYRAHYAGPEADHDACGPCRAAHAKYRRELWRRRYLAGTPKMYVENVGLRRRVRALCRMGWRFEDIAREAGYTGNYPAGWLNNLLRTNGKVHIKTHAKISGAYDRLCMKKGPSDHSRKIAVKRRWPPPLAWDDEDIDDPQAKPQGMKDRRSIAA